MNTVKMKYAALTTLTLALTPAAQAQTQAASSPQAAMTQFCRTLGQSGWQKALGEMLGMSEKDTRRAFAAMVDDANLVKLADQMFSSSRCEVLGGQGTQVRTRVSGPDATVMLDKVMNDEAVLRVYLSNIQATATRADMEQAITQSMQRQYQSGALPAYTQTVDIDMERTSNRWVLSDKGVETLFDGLAGGLARLQ